jgi:hypothetical protein
MIADHDLHTSVILYQLQEHSYSSAFLFSRCSPNFQAWYKGEWYLINLLTTVVEQRLHYVYLSTAYNQLDACFTVL